MSVPSSVLTQLSDLAVDGATVAATVFVLLVAIKAAKMLRVAVGLSPDSRGEYRLTRSQLREANREQMWINYWDLKDPDWTAKSIREWEEQRGQDSQNQSHKEIQKEQDRQSFDADPTSSREAMDAKERDYQEAWNDFIAEQDADTVNKKEIQKEHDRQGFAADPAYSPEAMDAKEREYGMK